MIALAGFHIKRQEFEPEYDNEAEMIVADMEFRDDDTEVIFNAHLLKSKWSKPVMRQAQHADKEVYLQSVQHETGIIVGFAYTLD